MDPVFDQRRYLIPFRSTLLPQIFTDTLVIGAGVAGIRAAIEASKHGEVIVLAKGDLRNTNTAWAQGGIAGVMGEEGAPGVPLDSFASHIEDTLTAGAGLCEIAAVRRVVEDGPERIREVLGWGMRADRRSEAGKQRGSEAGKEKRNGQAESLSHLAEGVSHGLSLGREGGHSAARIIHAGGDATGRELHRALLEKARSIDSHQLRIFEDCFALDLITPSAEVGSPVMGAITHHPKYGLQVIWAKATILATGGAGVLFRETTNPPLATADGLAMAYRAGATLSDMAFVQFHPTTLYLPGANRALITEAVRGEGAYLLDSSKHRFMLDVHPLAELAPRDIVALAIVRQLAKQGGGHVWLDCRHIANFEARFPSVAALLKQFSLNPAKDLIPVHPAAHYAVGGVWTDASGRTSVPGLYAAGEAASTGLHGANRLASNSLLEGLVYGEITGRICAEMKSGHLKSGESDPLPPGWSTPARPSPVPIVSDIRPSDQGELDLEDVRSSLRSAMWKNVGIERTGAKLHGVVDMLNFWARYTLDKIFDEPSGWETQNMLLVGALIARSALWREESRGCHTRLDFPMVSDERRVHDHWRRGVGVPTTVVATAPAYLAVVAPRTGVHA